MDVSVKSTDRFSHVPHVRIGSTPDILSRIHEPGVNLAIWERPDFSPTTTEAIDAITNTEAFFAMGTGKNKGFHLPVFSRHKLPHLSNIDCLLSSRLPGLNAVAEDMYMIYGLYSKIVVGGANIRTEMRVDVKHRSEDIFHTDYEDDQKKVRILVYYYGDGSDWVEDKGIIRLGPNAAAARSDEFVHPMRRFDVAVLRGGHNGIFHRTPPIRVSPKRILGVLDAVH